ncbi:putative glutamate receptor [Oratosquilla oratoria]|uniref:putative glutamate receptor n=1 Tax=Oratosquilla oratoria TaxID=337810 RepID=UPI003F75BF6B
MLANTFDNTMFESMFEHVKGWPVYINVDKEPYSGYMIEVFKIMIDQFKFCYEYVKSSDGLWGSPTPNGSWFGLMGILQRKEADIALGPFALSYQRAQVAEFTVPLIQTEHAITYKTPSRESDILGFVKPYTLDVSN